MFRYLVFIFAFILLGNNIYACDGGNGGSGGENGNDGEYQSLDAPPPLPPSFNSVHMGSVGDMFKNKDFIKLSDKNLREEEQTIRELKRTRLEGQQKRLNQRQEEAFDEASRANRKLQIAKGVGYASAAGASIIGAVAIGGAAVTVGTIGVVSDGISGAAGSLSDSYSHKKSISTAIKDATMEGVKKAIFTKFIAINKFGGSKAGSAVANFVSGLLYDHANNSASNLKDKR